MAQTPLQRTLPASYLLLLIETVKRWQISAAQLLDGTGVREDNLRDPMARLDQRIFDQILKRALTLTEEPGLGFFLGQQMKLSSHGFIGLAALTAHNVGEALEIAQRYMTLRFSAISLRLEVERDTALLYLDQVSPDYFIGEVAVFALLTGFAHMGNTATGKQLTGIADTRFAKPDYYDRFADWVAGEVRFNQPWNRLIFPASYLQLPLVMADPEAAQLARAQCEQELAQLAERSGFAWQVRQLLPDANGSFRTVEQVAELLHVSERTLKRQLEKQGTTYSELLEDLRHQRALQLLAQRDLSIDRIAELLGYSDVANFTRAFKRWTGQTPSQHRKR